MFRADVMLLRTVAVALLSFFPSTSRAEDAKPKLADPMVGTWKGFRTYDTLTAQFSIKVQRMGAGYTGRALEWYALTESQALQAASGQKPKIETNGYCVGRQLSVKVQDREVTVACQSSQPLLGKAVDLDLFIGKLTDTGFIVGNPGTVRRGGNIFRFWKEDALKKPLPLDLETGKTHKLECVEGGGYHYACYLPRDYDHDKPTPVLINFNPGGNAEPLSVKLADELGWIMAGLTESKNGPYWVIHENRDTVLFDLRRRFNIDAQRVYVSGFSGGARASSMTAVFYPGMVAGLILIGASHENVLPPKDQPIFYIAGQTDENKREVEDAYGTDKKNGRKCQLVIHPGGHEWGRPEDIENALRWLAKETAPQKPAGKPK